MIKLVFLLYSHNWFFFKVQVPTISKKNQVYHDGQRCVNLEIIQQGLWVDSESNSKKCSSISNATSLIIYSKWQLWRGQYPFAKVLLCVKIILTLCFSHPWPSTEQISLTVCFCVYSRYSSWVMNIPIIV